MTVRRPSWRKALAEPTRGRLLRASAPRKPPLLYGPRRTTASGTVEDHTPSLAGTPFARRQRARPALHGTARRNCVLRYNVLGQLCAGLGRILVGMVRLSHDSPQVPFLIQLPVLRFLVVVGSSASWRLWCAAPCMRCTA